MLLLFSFCHVRFRLLYKQALGWVKTRRAFEMLFDYDRSMESLSCLFLLTFFFHCSDCTPKHLLSTLLYLIPELWVLFMNVGVKCTWLNGTGRRQLQTSLNLFIADCLRHYRCEKFWSCQTLVEWDWKIYKWQCKQDSGWKQMWFIWKESCRPANS